MDPSPPSAPLAAAAARLLRPLIRLLIRSGVTCPMLTEIIRGLYVDTARAMLPDDRARTDSRLSLMTGIHRKELRRHRESGGETVAHPTAIGSQIAASWLGAPGLQDSAGQPIPLPRTAPDGAPSFEALVTAVTRDIRPRAVLEDWLAQDLVALDDQGRVVLQARAFLPQPGTAEQLFFLGRNLHDHVAAAAANIRPDPPDKRFLDRSVHYDGLSAEAAARLAALAREAAERLLLDVNRAALAIAEEDDRAATAPRRHRVNLGAYLFEAEDAP